MQHLGLLCNQGLGLGLGLFRASSVIVISLTSLSIAKISALFLVLGLLRYGRECTRVKRCVYYVIIACIMRFIVVIGGTSEVCITKQLSNADNVRVRVLGRQ